MFLLFTICLHVNNYLLDYSYKQNSQGACRGVRWEAPVSPTISATPFSSTVGENLQNFRVLRTRNKLAPHLFANPLRAHGNSFQIMYTYIYICLHRQFCIWLCIHTYVWLFQFIYEASLLPSLNIRSYAYFCISADYVSIQIAFTVTAYWHHLGDNSTFSHYKVSNFIALWLTILHCNCENSFLKVLM